jgi:structural maintenance of chromosomes protein 5
LDLSLFFVGRDAVREKQHLYKQLEESARIITQKFNDGKERLRKMKAEAESTAVLLDENGNDTPLKRQLDALDVSNLMEVDAAIEDAERILSQYSANPEVLLHYNKLKDEIELIEAQLADCTSTQEKGLQLLADQRQDWEKRLEKYIVKVNSLFTQYMAEMGCTGEVALKKGPMQEDGQEHKDNFRNWGLEIRVSFREGCKAEVLSAQRHSGGERSVSTILYLMALQDLMVAPFRCVDEINQGLDERNERLVFKRIVMNSCRPPKTTSVDHSGQYFLITPKLLPNLTAMEEDAMTVLFVFNGPFNFKSPTDWDSMLQDARDIEVINDDEENSDNVVPRRKSKKSRMS